jgi:cation transport ATPase
MLSALHRRVAYAVLALVFASGLAHLLVHDYFPARGPFGPAPNPLEPWLLKIHGAAAMATLVVFGSLVPTHIARFWQLAHNRLPGVLFLAVTLLLIATGYGLYYFGGDELRQLARQAHIVLGAAAVPAFVYHSWRGAAERRAARHGALRRHPSLHPRRPS